MVSVISGNIVNEGRIFSGSIKICGDTIVDIIPLQEKPREGDPYILPGVIDEHVHFREPGMTDKGDIATESRAAAAGGVTTFMDMPNTCPQTTTIDALKHKIAIAKQSSLVNYAFYLGATHDNMAELQNVDTALTPGIKLFMGASTGNMLVDSDEALNCIFEVATRRGLPIIAHCEDSAMIARNEEKLRKQLGNEAGVEFHPIIRNEEVCANSTRKAIALARKHNANLMVAHVSTATELQEIAATQGHVRAEGCLSYLMFSNEDYATLGARIKCNPAIKSANDRQALRQALSNGAIYAIATDHAPHLPANKKGGVFQAASGMPSVQFSLVLMLQLAEEGVLSLPRVAELMSHNPAQYFGVYKRGFIRKGYKADIAVVSRLTAPHIISDKEVLSRCGWTPYAGLATNWQVEATYCNGIQIYTHNQGITVSQPAGQQVEFHHADNAQI
ncbi:MAG: amidohydrolase family protein [Bacteroidaceae bacterium]|nr:amidohydrolase family protein [Bacteroidaceae bacterium]